MKTYLPVALICVLTGFAFQLHAEAYEGSKADIEESSREVVDRGEGAGLAEAGYSSCDPGYVDCSCIPVSHDESGGKLSGTD